MLLCNLRGATLVGMGLLIGIAMSLFLWPFTIWYPLLLMCLAIVLLDLRCRWRNMSTIRMKRLLLPQTGGYILFLPAWLLGAVVFIGMLAYLFR